MPPALREFDERILYDLGFLGLSDQQMATCLQCHQSLLSKRADLAKVVAGARWDRSLAIARLWIDGPGQIRDDDRVQVLAGIVWAGEQRKVRRMRPIPAE